MEKVNKGSPMNALKTIALPTLLSLVYGCSHPIEIVGEGDVLSATGTRNCYYEDFLAGAESCSKNLVVRAYDETYYAVARDGWEFEQWLNYSHCADTGNECAFDIPADWVENVWGQTVPPLVAVFSAIAPPPVAVFSYDVDGVGSPANPQPLQDALLQRQTVYFSFTGDYSKAGFWCCQVVGGSEDHSLSAFDEYSPLVWRVDLAVLPSDDGLPRELQAELYDDDGNVEEYAAQWTLEARSEAEIFGPLVDGIQLLSAPGSPSPVWPEDSAWVPIVSGDEDSSIPSLVSMARIYGSGRVFMTGLAGQFQGIANHDNRPFLVNVAAWLNPQGGNRVKLSSGHGERLFASRMADYALELQSLGYTYEVVGAPLTNTVLTETDILVIGSAWSDFSDQEIADISAYVKQGGGLLLSGTGWSWVAYHPGSTIEQYPMNRLAAPFAARWPSSIFRDPTDSVDGSVLFDVLYPDAASAFPTLASAFEYIRTVNAAHPDDLEVALQSDLALQAAYVKAHMVASVPVTANQDPPIEREQVYDFSREMAIAYPQYFTKAPIFDAAKYPAMVNLRERFFRTWVDAKPLDPAVKADIADLAQFSGRYRDIWNAFSVYLMDNSSLDAPQQEFIYDLLQSIPGNLHALRAISVSELLGTPPAQLNFNALTPRVNVFDRTIGAIVGNQFPDDVAPGYADGFVSVTVHEVNHTVYSYTAAAVPAVAERRAALIASAGDDHMNYLRSMLPDGFFTKAPQEFFASISSQWFTDSLKTIELGLVRFDNGYLDPINQALFFADVYSSWGNSSSYFYATDTSGHIQRVEVPLTRDDRGRITGFSYAGSSYAFSLDDNGDVASYTVTPL